MDDRPNNRLAAIAYLLGAGFSVLCWVALYYAL